MNEPIISPWIFYWIELLSTVKGFCFAFGLIMACCVVVGVVETVEREYFWKWFKPCSVVLGILLFLFMAIPSEKTMYKMLVSSYVTPNNIEYVKNEVKVTSQQVVDSITNASIKIIEAQKGR